jgi:hypothetical protein
MTCNKIVCEAFTDVSRTCGVVVEHDCIVSCFVEIDDGLQMK